MVGAVVLIGAIAQGSAYAAEIEALRSRGVMTTGTVLKSRGRLRTAFP